MADLCHYTINTGHVRQSPRSEVTIDLALLAPLLRTGEHVMPHLADYGLRVTVDGDVLAATVHRGPAPLATVFVCSTQQGLDAVLRLTGCIPSVPLTLPAALVETHPTLTLDPDAVSWLGDFERCLAWAFLERRRD